MNDITWWIIWGALASATVSALDIYFEWGLFGFGL